MYISLMIEVEGVEYFIEASWLDGDEAVDLLIAPIVDSAVQLPVEPPEDVLQEAINAVGHVMYYSNEIETATIH